MNLGGLNLGDLMKQAQQVQEQMQSLQQDLRARTFEAESGAGMVKVTVNGAQELLFIHIDTSLINPNEPQMLQDLIVAAVNKSLAESRETVESEVKKITGMLPKIPGLPF